LLLLLGHAFNLPFAFLSRGSTFRPELLPVPHFCYEARDPQGQLVVGQATGPGHLDVVVELKKVGYQVVQVWQKPPLLPGARIWSFYKRVPLAELALVTRELGMFFESGIGLVKGLESMEAQGFSKQTGQACKDVATALNAGSSFSQSLGLRPDVFPPVYIKLVHAGEVSGALDRILGRLSDHLERELIMTRRVQSAMAYPALIFAVCVLLTAFLVFFLFPVFVSLFDGLNTRLPAVTRSLVAVTTFIRQPGTILAILVAPYIGSKLYDYFASKDSSVLWFSELLLRLPMLGSLKRALVLSRFSSTLGILLDSGIAQYSAITITADALDNRAAQAAVFRAADRVKNDGDSLSEALSKEPLFPRMLVSLILIGEEVGDLPRILNLAYQGYELDVETTVSRLTVMMEPLILFLMGGIVGYVLLAVFLPVYSMLDGL
jgi:type IV pilus assembly protein PilC